MMKKALVFSAIFLFIVLMCFVLIFTYFQIKYPLKFKNEIEKAAVEFDVGKELVASIINAESSFRKDVVSRKGAVGLMQILPETALWVSLTNSNFENKVEKEMLFNPETNIRIGTCYVKYLIKKFENLEVALCAYNAGEGVVSGWLKNNDISPDGKTLSKIPYAETKNYVEKVKKSLKIYEKRF